MLKSILLLSSIIMIPNFKILVQTKGSSYLSRMRGKGGARATILFLSAPPPEKILGVFSARSKRARTFFRKLSMSELVGVTGFEPATSRTPCARATIYATPRGRYRLILHPNSPAVLNLPPIDSKLQSSTD